MFEYSLVPSGKAHALPIVGACISEVMMVGGLLLIPLLFVQSLPERALFNGLMLAPVPAAPPSPPPPMLVAKPIHRTAPAPRMFNPDALVSPVVVPKEVAVINDAPTAQMDAIAGGVPGGIPGMAGINGGTGFFSAALSAAPPPPLPPKALAPAVPPPPAAPKQITVGGQVQAAMLVEQVPPVYPAVARQGHIHGSVILKAVIGTDGRIKNLVAMSGNPLLVEAALSAVRRWVYRPTVLNGTPVEVNTEIEVRFGFTSQTGS